MQEFEGENFKNMDGQTSQLTVGEYDNCSFSSCDFSGVDIGDFVFSECEFMECNLSNAKLHNTSFKDVIFVNCKLVGLSFNICNPFLFEVGFQFCDLSLTSFYQRSLKKTVFADCSLREADFAEADLSQSQFKNCDLALALFENTNLEKTDLSSSHGFSIDPELNNIKKAKFARSELRGLLGKYEIEIV